MPKIVRAMLIQDGLPLVGTDANMLGVRVPNEELPGKAADVSPDGAGNIHPYGGGLSVAWSVDDVLPHLVPRRLKSFVEGASASNNRRIWSMGRGSFSDGGIAHRLILRRKPERADGRVLGLVEPAATMPLEEYQSALAATRPQWSLDEPS